MTVECKKVFSGWFTAFVGVALRPSSHDILVRILSLILFLPIFRIYPNRPACHSWAVARGPTWHGPII
jgi:hypothetical protein